MLSALCYAQNPITERSWHSVALDMPADWYGSDESKTVAENVLLYQRNSGGWPKNLPLHNPLSDEEKKALVKDKDEPDATFDNGATITEMKFLAKMIAATGDRIYRQAFDKSLEYIFNAQYSNGGWPQFYPLKKGYSSHITYNDNSMVNILQVLRDVYEGKNPYSFISNEIRQKAGKSYDKGIECILATQIMMNGKPTVWCAQHDEKTLQPAKARSYELPSFSGAESAGLLLLLMDIENPSPEIIRAVAGGIEWLEAHKLINTRWDYFTNQEGEKDRRIVTDPEAGDMWARFYDLETQLPYVCDRDGIKKSSLDEIGYERRNGYSWYTEAPQKVLNAFPAWSKKWIQKQ